MRYKFVPNGVSRSKVGIRMESTSISGNCYIYTTLVPRFAGTCRELAHIGPKRREINGIEFPDLFPRVPDKSFRTFPTSSLLCVGKAREMFGS